MREEMSMMDKIKKFFSNKLYLGLTIGAAVLLVAGILLAILLPGNSGNGDTPSADLTGCTVELKTEGGMALEGIEVRIYTDANKGDLVGFAKTDAKGIATFDVAVPQGSVVALEKLPAGYVAQDSYPITQAATQIVLDIELLQEMTDITLGGVMFDFTVTTPEGTSYTLSQLLEQKKAVVLNLWYTGCDPCKSEFPYLQFAYDQYSSNIEVLAIDPEDTDDDAAVSAFKTALDLTIPMAKCDAGWKDIVSDLAYPTTIVIDRFGTVALIHTGAVDNSKVLEDTFAFFTAEDYVQTTVANIEDLLVEDDTPAKGSKENPEEIAGVQEFEVTVESGETYYCNIFRVFDMELKVESETLSLNCDGTDYAPEEGVISFVLSAPDTYTPVLLAFTNNGSAAETYKVTLTSLPGSIDAPFELAEGEMTADIPAGNEQGVYYTITAKEDGIFTLECIEATEGVEYDFTLYNLNSYQQLTYSGNGTTSADGNPVVSINVSAGDEVQVIVSTLPDENNEYPAAQLKFEATFGEGEQKGTTQGGSQGGSTGGNQGGSTAGNQGGSTSGNQGGSTGGNQGGSTGGNQGGSTGGNQGGSTGGSTGGTTGFVPTEYEELYVGNAYFVKTGDNALTLKGSDVNYFAFVPEKSGKYKVSVDAGTLSYYGNNTAFIQDLSNTVGCNGKSFSVNIKEGNLGSMFILGVKGSGTVKLTITRTGAAELDVSDLPVTTFGGTATPSSPYTYSGGNLKRIDVTGATVTLEKKGDYYYLNGKQVFVNLDDDTYLSINDFFSSDRPILTAVDTNKMISYDFTACMEKYKNNKDKTTGVYPLNDDLKFMFETLYKWQWANPSPNPAMFGDDVDKLNKEIGWMFCCYYEA